MIIYSCLMRTQDGLPLSSANEFARVPEATVEDVKNLSKLLIKQIGSLPQRFCIEGDDLSVHCIKDESTSYVIICEPSFPHILAYSFLDELIKEFSILYTPSVVNSVKRPFGFVEFESYLYEVQSKYNSPHSLSALLNLPDMTNDLNLNPPIYLKISDLGPLSPKEKEENSVKHTTINLSNGTIKEGNSEDHTKVIKPKLKVLSWYGRLAVLLVLPCLFLDVYRGLVILGSFYLEDSAGASHMHGLAFLLEMIFLILQIVCLRKCFKYRKLVALASFISVTLINIYMAHFRELIVVILYAITSFLLWFATLRRGIEKILPRFCI